MSTQKIDKKMKVVKWILASVGILFVTLVVLLVIGYFTGFVVVEGNGLHSEYAKLSEDKQARVKDAVEMDSLKADGNVYRVRHEQVKKYLNGKGKALVYSYIPYCTKDNCTDPKDCFNKCKEVGVELVLISELYYKLFENTTEYLQPVFVINSDSYGSDDREEYVRMFYDGLIGEDNWSRLTGCYFCFNHGQYIKQCEKFDEALDILKE